MESCKIGEVIEMIRMYENTNWEYQEARDCARDELAIAIFKCLEVEPDWD